MPIIVHRGADHHSRKKKQLLHQSSSEELLGDKKKPSVVNEKEDLGQQIAKDLAEILDFRVYRVKDTTTFLDREKKTETVLIGGDQFYSKEESSQELKKLNNQDASATTRTDAVAEKANGKETQLYGTVQNLVASSKRIDSNANKAEFLAKIRNSSHRLNLIKSGHKMLDLLEEPDVDSTIDWAFDYVQHYQSALIPSLLELCQHLKYFDSKKKDSLAGNEANLDMSHEDLHKMCLRSKSILFFSKNAKSFSAAASVDRAGDNYKSVNLVGKVQKAVPLHQQLENLRLQGTERFLSLLTDNESSRPSSEASEIIPKAPSMINGAKPIIRDTTRRSESHIDDAEKSVSEKEKDHEVLRAASPVGGKRSNKSFQRHRKVVEISTNSMISKEPQANNTSNMPDFESKKQILPEKGKDTQDSSIKTLRIPQSSVAAAIIDRFIDKFRIVEGLSDPKPTLTTNPHHSVVREKRHSAVKSALNGSSANSQQPVRYSNIVDDVHPEHSLTGKDAESIRLREATLRACEERMVYANNLIEMANKKTTSLEENIRKNLKNSEKAGNRLVSRWSGFYSSKSEDRHHMNHLFVDREFKRSTNLKEHLKFFPSGTAKDDTDHKKKLGVDMGYDLRYMKSKADQDQYQTYIRRLLAARWFIFSVNKVKGEMKRISMIVPQSCYIFLAVYQEVVMLGYENNQLIFYRILEKTITVKDDYRKTVVHVVLSAARGAVHISADAFLEYLNSREIEPPTELIQEIRAQQKNKSRKDKLKANIYRKMRVKHTGIITESDSSRHQIPMAFPSPSSQTVSCDTYDTASSADSADDFGRSDQSYPDIMGIIDGNQPSNNPQGGKGTILAEELDSTSVMSALVEDDAVESN